MNQRRIEMEAKLPDASPNLMNFLWHKTNEAGLSIPNEDIAFIGKLVSDFIKNTPEGKVTTLRLLNADIKQASVLKTYYPEGWLGDYSRKIKPEDLIEFRGWIYQKRQSIPHHSIDVDDREDSTICDSCGGKFPYGFCAKEIETVDRSGRNSTQTICNHCRASSDDMKLKSSADHRKCKSCEKRNCDYHPNNNSKLPLLPYQAKALKEGRVW